MNENVWILIKISLKFVPEVRINNIPALVQIMAWHRPGNKPLSEPMMVRLPTHICVTRLQWVNLWIWAIYLPFIRHEVFTPFEAFSIQAVFTGVRCFTQAFLLSCLIHAGQKCTQTMEAKASESINYNMSYRQILWSLTAARYGFSVIWSLWNLRFASAALLLRSLSHFNVTQ